MDIEVAVGVAEVVGNRIMDEHVFAATEVHAVAGAVGDLGIDDTVVDVLQDESVGRVVMNESVVEDEGRQVVGGLVEAV